MSDATTTTYDKAWQLLEDMARDDVIVHRGMTLIARGLSREMATLDMLLTALRQLREARATYVAHMERCTTLPSIMSPPAP